MQYVRLAEGTLINARPLDNVNAALGDPRLSGKVLRLQA